MEINYASWDQISQVVSKYINQHKLFNQSDRVLVAVSGGPDSIFLAHVLHYLGYELGIAHVNYQLRGADSEEEENMVQHLADYWNIPIWVQTIDTQQLLTQGDVSLQMLARRLRYQFFDQLLVDEGFKVCATAHHKDDDIETLLLSLIKGNQFDLFYRIPVKRGPYARPLLDIRKEDIVQALHQAGISYSIDYTNLENIYQRNRVRNEIIPSASVINPRLTDHLITRYEWYKDQVGMLKILLSDWYTQCVEEGEESTILNDQVFLESPYHSYKKVLYAYTLQQWGLHGHLLWEGVQLAYSMSGKKLDMPDGSIIYKTSVGLEWVRVKPDLEWEYELLEIDDTVTIRSSTGHYISVIKHNTVNIPYIQSPNLFMDIQKLHFPLKIRHWSTGDKMVPLGMRLEKKLSDIFIDEKFTPMEKERAIVIESNEMIVGVLGFRIADSVKIDTSTRAVIEIAFSK